MADFLDLNTPEGRAEVARLGLPVPPEEHAPDPKCTRCFGTGAMDVWDHEMKVPCDCLSPGNADVGQRGKEGPRKAAGEAAASCRLDGETRVIEPVSAVVLTSLAHGLPAPIAEYPFCSGRRWRFDFAWPDQKVALEVQGGNWKRGRHTRAAALLKEYEKLNAAACLGWRILYAAPADVESGAVYALIRQALEAKT